MMNRLGCIIENKSCGFQVPCHWNTEIIIASVFAALVLLTGAASAYGGGDGSVGSPYEISDSGDLINLSMDSGNWSHNFILTADISLPDDGSPTSTIGNRGTEFTGSFDGQGHTIRNFEMNKPDDDNVGLFGYIEGGELTNLGIEAGASGVSGHSCVGVLVGSNYQGSITNCSATGNATAAKDDAGGLVGNHCEGPITNCYATGDASAASYAGGLAGVNEMGTITNCYATGNATVAKDYAGGLVGYLYISSVTNCFATGDASASSDAGGLAGYSNEGTITNCYRYADYGDDRVTRVSDLSKFRDYSFITGTTEKNGLNWSMDIISTETDYSIVWYVPSSKTEYPTFQWGISGTLLVNSIPDGAVVLFNGVNTEKNTNQIFNNQPVGVYHVTVERAGYTSSPDYVDVTLARDDTKIVVFTLTENKYSGGEGTAESPYEISDSGDLINLSTDSGNWDKYFIQTVDIDLPDNGSPTSAIGYSGTTFTGRYDGQGHTIRNFEMNKSGDEYVGLFGYVEGGEIQNLEIEAGLRGVSGHSFVGVLAGCNYGGSITSCSAAGGADADNYAGGLVGANIGSITNCYATGNTTASSDAGGLVGQNVGGSITNCYATGDASASSDAGGLVGGNVGGSITNSYATGDASASSDAGGLVGGTDGGTITNCYRYADYGDSRVTCVSVLSTFGDYDFITGTTEKEGLSWSTDIISTTADSSKIWRAAKYRFHYPIFQWHSYESGTLQVYSSPENAAILLNGVSTGEITNHSFYDLPVGVYNVTVLKDGCSSASQNVTLTKDELKYVSFILEQLNVSVSLSAGWNMISVPVANATIIVPTEADQIYRCNGNVYESVADLASVPPGVGLWIAATGPCTLTFTGTAVYTYTELVSAGWNMIGSCTESVPFAGHLASNPAGELNDQIYTYDPAGGTYVTPASCTPGCGYWISAKTGCNVSLSKA